MPYFRPVATTLRGFMLRFAGTGLVIAIGAAAGFVGGYNHGCGDGSGYGVSADAVLVDGPSVQSPVERTAAQQARSDLSVALVQLAKTRAEITDLLARLEPGLIEPAVRPVPNQPVAATAL